MPREYEKFEFCKDIECPVLDSDDEIRSNTCEHHCQCSAYDLHDWLNENNFKIVKDGA